MAERLTKEERERLRRLVENGVGDGLGALTVVEELALCDALDAAEKERDDLRRQRDQARRDRDGVVRILAACATLGIHDDNPRAGLTINFADSVVAGLQARHKRLEEAEATIGRWARYIRAGDQIPAGERHEYDPEQIAVLDEARAFLAARPAEAKS